MDVFPITKYLFIFQRFQSLQTRDKQTIFTRVHFIYVLFSSQSGKAPKMAALRTFFMRFFICLTTLEWCVADLDMTGARASLEHPYI